MEKISDCDCGRRTHAKSLRPQRQGILEKRKGCSRGDATTDKNGKAGKRKISRDGVNHGILGIHGKGTSQAEIFVVTFPAKPKGNTRSKLGLTKPGLQGFSLSVCSVSSVVVAAGSSGVNHGILGILGKGTSQTESGALALCVKSLGACSLGSHQTL